MILATDASAHETQNDPKEWCELDDEVVRANVVRVHCLLREIIPASVHVPDSRDSRILPATTFGLARPYLGIKYSAGSRPNCQISDGC